MQKEKEVDGNQENIAQQNVSQETMQKGKECISLTDGFEVNIMNIALARLKRMDEDNVKVPKLKDDSVPKGGLRSTPRPLHNFLTKTSHPTTLRPS